MNNNQAKIEALASAFQILDNVAGDGIAFHIDGSWKQSDDTALALMAAFGVDPDDNGNWWDVLACKVLEDGE